MEQIKLPADVAEIYALQREIPVVVVTGVGRIDFNTISMTMAKRLNEKTGDKYLKLKAKSSLAVKEEKIGEK